MLVVHTIYRLFCSHLFCVCMRVFFLSLYLLLCRVATNTSSRLVLFVVKFIIFFFLFRRLFSFLCFRCFDCVFMSFSKNFSQVFESSIMISNKFFNKHSTETCCLCVSIFGFQIKSNQTKYFLFCFVLIVTCCCCCCCYYYYMLNIFMYCITYNINY